MSIGREQGRVATALCALCLCLAACGEKPQQGTQAAKKSDAKAWDGSSQPGFTAGGWKAGDATAWERQIKARNQQQNEYVRAQQ